MKHLYKLLSLRFHFLCCFSKRRSQKPSRKMVPETHCSINPSLLSEAEPPHHEVCCSAAAVTRGHLSASEGELPSTLLTLFILCKREREILVCNFLDLKSLFNLVTNKSHLLTPTETLC